jgi:hypothetical protein
MVIMIIGNLKKLSNNNFMRQKLKKENLAGLFIILGFILLLMFIIVIPIMPKKNIVHFDHIKYNFEKEKWNKLGIENYEFNITNDDTGMIQYDTHIIIKNNIFASKENNKLGNIYYNNYTINDIFNEIESNYQTNNKKTDFFDTYIRQIIIEYNDKYHFPEKIIYVYNKIPFATDQGNHFERLYGFNVFYKF